LYACLLHCLLIALCLSVTPLTSTRTHTRTHTPHLACTLFLFIPQMGGSEAIISALVRGLEKHGGRLMLRSHVDSILMEEGRATGVVLRPRQSPSKGEVRSSNGKGRGGMGAELVKARRGVISNASCWDTHRLLPKGAAPTKWVQSMEGTPQVCCHCYTWPLGLSWEAIAGWRNLPSQSMKTGIMMSRTSGGR